MICQTIPDSALRRPQTSITPDALPSSRQLKERYFSASGQPCRSVPHSMPDFSHSLGVDDLSRGHRKVPSRTACHGVPGFCSAEVGADSSVQSSLLSGSVSGKGTTPNAIARPYAADIHCWSCGTQMCSRWTLFLSMHYLLHPTQSVQRPEQMLRQATLLRLSALCNGTQQMGSVCGRL